MKKKENLQSSKHGYQYLQDWIIHIMSEGYDRFQDTQIMKNSTNSIDLTTTRPYSRYDTDDTNCKTHSENDTYSENDKRQTSSTFKNVIHTTLFAAALSCWARAVKFAVVKPAPVW